MISNISPPADNLYKFSCIFGLAVIISCIFSFVSVYTNSLETSIKYSLDLIPLEAKRELSKDEEMKIAHNKNIIEITQKNRNAANLVIIIISVMSMSLSIWGGNKWYSLIQKRDDLKAQLEIEKLQVEIANLKN